MATNPALRAVRFPRLVGAALLLAGTVLLFDVAAWFLVPDRYTAFSSSYRKTRLLDRGPPGQPAMTRGFQRHYFRADPALGFDIAPGARGLDEVENVPYEIFANSLGCFDRNELPAFKGAREYYYFAGDSFTWGFAEYDSKFATVWERLTGKVAAKCGVTHTGQAHQFGKFTRFAAAIGRNPAAVFVGFYVNDPVNDEAHPHSTVVDGYLADTAFLKDGAIVHPPESEVRQVVEASIRELAQARPPSGLERLKAAVWVYSLSANIVNHLRLAAAGRVAADARAGAPAAAEQGPRATGRFGGNLYYWYGTDAMKARYASDPMTAANRSAILRWATHARENSYRLVLLLFPPKASFDDPEYFSQVRAWLDANGIEHLDLAQVFRQERLDQEALYWGGNAHWHAGGNRIVGRLLAARLP